MLYLLPPPAAIPTNCFFDFAPRNVIGVACALAGNFVVQISFPVSLSNARKRLSFVAPIKTRPPAVVSEPPRFGAPVGGIPFAISSSTTPSTDCQRKSPVSRLMAVRNPPGGFWHGLRSLSHNPELRLPEPGGRYRSTDAAGRF